jgi:hypothetical protein
MSNTPAQTTDPLKHSVGTQYQQIGFYGATGSVGPVATTGATAGTDAVAASISAALKTLGLIS